MSATDPYGYRSGPRQPLKVYLDSTTGTVEVGDMLTMATAGYFKKATASSDIIYGVAMSRSAAPTADGDNSVLMDCSPDSVYCYPPDAGSVTAALRWKTCDAGTDARSANIDASAADPLLIVDVDTDNNWVYVKIRPSFSGVV